MQGATINSNGSTKQTNAKTQVTRKPIKTQPNAHELPHKLQLQQNKQVKEQIKKETQQTDRQIKKELMRSKTIICADAFFKHRYHKAQLMRETNQNNHFALMLPSSTTATSSLKVVGLSCKQTTSTGTSTPSPGWVFFLGFPAV